MKASASVILAVLVGVLALGSALEPAAPLVRAPGEARSPASSRPAPASTPTLRPSVGPPLIEIPRLGVEATVGNDLDQGPMWWPVTGRPGGGDTIAIAGHRTTHTRPFYALDRLRPGDSIFVRWAGRMHEYRVSGTRILSAKQLHIADARGHEVLLLSACHPKGSARQRIVVYAWPRA
jgi:sortase A